MTRSLVPLLATGLVVATMGWCHSSAAQQPPAAAPEPKMPAMPSMEGQQGDVSKPVTQIPPRKKPTVVETKAPVKATPPVKHAKESKTPRHAPARKKH